MKYAFVKDHTHLYGLGLMCRLLDVSKSGYYAWKRAGSYIVTPARILLEEEVRNAFIKSHKRYGSPRIYLELKKAGVAVSKTTVEQIMKDLGLVARKQRRFVSTTDSDHNDPVAPNHLGRNFEGREPGEVLLSDITYIPMPKGLFVYLCVVMDLASRQIIGWHLSDRIDTELVSVCLMRALRVVGAVCEGALFHSDQGSQYAAKSFVNLVAKSGYTQSMSRRGQCWDNAPMESFFTSLKTELANAKYFKSMDEANSSLFEYIEIFYNRERTHSGIDGKIPAQVYD